MKAPAPAAESFAIAPGIVALPGGLALLERSRTLIAADAHFAYEDVVGGALPLWSTDEIAARIAIAVAKTSAVEVIFLGDVIHGARMSEGASRRVAAALAALRREARITIVAGNHEGATRGIATLGEVVEETVRDGWLLVHGDKPKACADPVIIGHLHPSLHLGGTASVPVFAGSARFVVLPALTPYSSGLNVLSTEFTRAIGAWTASRDLHVVASGDDAVYPFGALNALRSLLRQPVSRPAARRFRRKLRAD